MTEGAPRAMVMIVHGITEHTGRYENVVRPLVAAGMGVCGFDLRGHGRSAGERGHLEWWRDLVVDVDLFLRLIHGDFPAVPIFSSRRNVGDPCRGDDPGRRRH